MKHRTSARFLLLLASISCVLIGPGVQSHASAEEEGEILEYRYSGSSLAGIEFERAMRSRAVQSLLLDVAAAPRTQNFVNAVLRETSVSAGQLRELGLVRLNGDRYELAFSLLTREDRSKIRAVAEAEGGHLASALLESRPRIETLLRDGSAPDADWRTMAYFILGCISLDWDGLGLAREKGYLTVPGEGRYLPTAYQPVPRETVRQLYWGSHSFTDSIMFTTFGDHYSLPRLGVPDVLSTIISDAPEPIASQVRHVASDLLRRHAGALMLELREGAQPAGRLASTTGIAQEDAQAVLDLLQALQYVSESNGVYRAEIPVLTERDRSLVAQLRLLGREAMLDWYEDRYAALCDQLADLTPSRYRVPLSDSFYWVWHYLFGVANRELVSAGLFADPYDPKRKFHGFIPAVIQLEILH